LEPPAWAAALLIRIGVRNEILPAFTASSATNMDITLVRDAGGILRVLSCSYNMRLLAISISAAEPASKEKELAHTGAVAKRNQKIQHVADTRITIRLREQPILPPESAIRGE
jgi:hypothetical protein